jgi:hypothetical protein
MSERSYSFIAIDVLSVFGFTSPYSKLCAPSMIGSHKGFYLGVVKTELPERLFG